MYVNDWKWLDFASVPGVLDWLGFVLGGLGIGFTIWQLLKSESAYKAAQEALEETRDKLVRNQLVAELPEFRKILDLIDADAASGNRDSLSDSLYSFAFISRATISLLNETPGDFLELVSSLRKAAGSAMDIRSKLYEPLEITTAQLLRSSDQDLRQVVLEIHELSVTMRNDLGSSKKVRKVQNAR